MKNRSNQVVVHAYITGESDICFYLLYNNNLKQKKSTRLK